MINWRKVPFIRILIPFVTGIILASQKWVEVLGHPLLLMVLFAFCFSLLSLSFSFSKKWIAGLLINLFFLVFAYQMTLQHHHLNNNAHFGFHHKANDLILGIVNEQPTLKNNLRFVLKVQSLGPNHRHLQPAEGLLMTYVPVDSASTSLAYGDLLAIKAPIRPIDASLNPHAFDYRAYLDKQNIFYQTRPDSLQWTRLSTRQGNALMALSLSIRNHFLTVFRSYLPGENEYAIAAALVLGDKSSISDEVRNAYADTGALHVLAVSGLHVGFIALGLGWLLGLFRSYNKKWKVIRTLLILSGVWTYALLTGASPSVLRAASMFSFLVIGQSLQRFSSIYNTLAVSAFFLLLFNPGLLFEPGFQLSYLAVTGIVFFYQRIYSSWIIDNPFGDYFWKMAAIGIAAQITTFPLGLYYFHQFPIYFWLSGIIVVPAAMLVLPLGILLLLTDALIPVVAVLISKLLYGVLWLSTSLIFLLQQLPGGLVEGVWISGFILFLLYLIIVNVMAGIENQKGKWFIYAAALTLLLAITSAFHTIEIQSSQKVVVYNIYRNSLIDLQDGRNALSISNSELDPVKESFAARNNRMANGIKSIKKVNFTSKAVQSDSWIYENAHLQFYKTRFAFIDRQPPLVQNRFGTDYLIIRNNPKLSIDQLKKSYHFKMIIIDGSNSRYSREKWVRECKELNIPVYDLPREGAFILDLKNTL